MATYKLGATLRIVLEFTDEEFDAVYPYDSVMAECENSTSEFPLTVTVDEPDKSFILTSPTDNFTKGTYKLDCRVEKEGIVIFIPSDSYVTFQMIPPVTEVGNSVITE